MKEEGIKILDALVSSCPFCRKFGYKNTPLHPVFDQILLKTDAFIVLPAKGSFVEGYLLILPRKHFYNMASLPPSLFSVLSDLKSIIRKVLSSNFNKPIFYEHGTINSSIYAGNSISHAHMHCVPCREDLLQLLPEKYRITRLKKFDDIRKQAQRTRSYVYFETNSQEHFIIDEMSVPSQFLRQIVANALGFTDQWNWRVHLFEHKAKKTLEILNAPNRINLS
jgi:ATP adenylyltransferase